MTRRPPTSLLLVGAGALALVCSPALAAGPIGADLPRFLGRLHPLVVHFPIALLAVAVLFELGAIVFRRERVRPTSAGLACVALGLLGAAAAAWFGWINADLEPHGRGVAGMIETHRWLGIATVGLAGVALVAALIGATGRARAMTAAYRVALVLAAGLVAVAGHWGGTIVYGEGYLTDVLFPEPSPARPEAETRLAELTPPGPATGLTVDFATQIAPIFADHCIDCHGPAKGKGNLRLHERRYVFDERDADAQVVIPGDAFASDLFFRITLPPSDEDAMPPEGDAEPLTAEEIDLLETWINEGAVWTDEPVVATVAPAGGDEPTSTPDTVEPPFVFDEAAAQAQDEAMERLRGHGAVVARLSAADPWVQVRFDLLGDQVTDDDLALLAGLEPTLVSLNLAGTGVTDAGLVYLSKFIRLERLHLDRTAITDAGLAHLAPLAALRYLNLYGTAVTDMGLVAAAQLPRLARLYVWDTRVSPEAGALLAALRPGLTVEVATEFEAAAIDGPPASPPTDTAAPTPDGEPAASPPEIDVALLPACCRAALAAGAECDHPCCVEARAAGEVCETCSR